jgi:flagellar biosynthesis GTPase FlhF
MATKWAAKVSPTYEVVEKGAKHVLHKVELDTGGEIIILERRTRHFKTLHAELTKVYPDQTASCQLPDIAFIRDYSEANLSAICLGLDTFLQQVFAIPELAQSNQLEMFLDNTAVAGIEKWRTHTGGGIGGKTTAVDVLLDGMPVDELRVGRKLIHEVPLEVNAADALIVWSFETLPNEILFSVICDGTEHKKKKERSSVKAAQGNFAMPKTWTASSVCSLRFDNSASPIRSRKLRFRAVVTTKEELADAEKRLAAGATIQPHTIRIEPAPTPPLPTRGAADSAPPPAPPRPTAEAEAEEQAKQEAEEQAKQEAEEKATKEAEEQVKQEAEEQAKQEAEEQVKQEAEEQAKQEAEEQATKEAEEQATKEVEEQAKQEAEEQAKQEADGGDKKLEPQGVTDEAGGREMDPLLRLLRAGQDHCEGCVLRADAAGP